MFGSEIDAVERHQVAREAACRVRSAELLRVGSVGGTAGGGELEHQQPLLRHREVEPGGLAEDRGGERRRPAARWSSASRVPCERVSSPATRRARG